MRELPDSPLSLWLAEYGEYEPAPSLSGELDIDVAVIGGGLTGMAAAIALKRRDPSLEVAVLEARTVGYGASGRNGSFAMTVVGLGFGTTALLRGKRFLQRAHSYMEGCVDGLERFIDEEGLECDKARPGFLRLATTPSYVKRLQKQVELMESLGFDDITWIGARETREMVHSERYLGAMWEPRLVLVNPAKLVREERRVALGLGVRVFEGTPVLAVVRGQGPEGVHRVLTPEGSVTARKLAFATNAYSHFFAELRRLQLPAFTYMVATEPLTDAQLARIGWEAGHGLEDARNLIHYYRLTPDRRIVIGGGPVGLTAGGDLDGDRNEGAWRHLENQIRWLWPHLSDVAITHRWGGAAAAQPAGAQPQVVDVAPGGSGDRRGTGLGSTALPLVLAGALVGIAASFLPRSMLGRAGLVAIGSLLAGGATLAIVQGWLDVLDHNWLANWGALSLIVLAVGSLVAGATALLGPRGIAVGVLPMMVIGSPLAAVASAPQLLPEPLGAIGQLFPPGAGGNLLRSTAYFDGAAAAGHIAVLAAWAAIGFGAIGLAAAPRRRRGAVPSRSRATRSMTRTAH
jgi:glycine/D-amino acid oxidase-like deaminating enzyme